MAESRWVAELIIPADTKRKLSGKHGLSWREVRDALVCVSGLRYTWDNDQERGERILVELRLRDRWGLAVLYPVADPLGDVYALITAYLYAA